jgi:UDP-N-acetylglucosamine 2-epimerase
MKIVSIVGARPEFVQEKSVYLALKDGHRETLVHTGQHYDYQMSQTFFDELHLPRPDYSLGVGSGSHAEQTAKILLALEPVLIQEAPDLVIVRGDTNSTLAGALAAAKLGIPFAHIEAGERSFNRRMPEEINRLVVDRLANLHFCVSQTAVQHLAAEGITGSVFWVGDVMLDALVEFLPLARARSNVLSRLGLQTKAYALVTLHRAGTVDAPDQLERVVRALNGLPETIVFPVHPRTQKSLQQLGIDFEDHIRAIEPVGYLDMLLLEENARLIATDSGGVQREAYSVHVPCLTLREETEWTETIRAGWNRLVGTDPAEITRGWFDFTPPADHPAIFGDGTAGKRISRVLRDTGGPDPVEVVEWETGHIQ